jgi:hypothetical protein
LFLFIFVNFQHPYKELDLQNVGIRIHPMSEFGRWGLNSDT